MRFKSLLACLLALCLCAGALPALTGAAQAAVPYYITVDVTNQIVTVYENGDRTDSGVVRQMICSTGKAGHSTPLGTYTLPYKSVSSERTEWYYFSTYSCYAKWATRIRGPYLFHSVIYNYRGGSPTSTSVNALGSRASHGCVRLRVADAKWIAQNCLAGTSVRIYSSGKTNSSLRSKLLNHSFDRDVESYTTFLGKSSGGGTGSGFPLKRGKTGDKVKKLQKRLKALGYFTGELGGHFYSITETAVRRFQKDAGVKQDGVVTEALWKRMKAADAPTGTWLTLKKGMTGPAVSTLQRALTAAKCYNGAINGKFNSATVKAMKKWQKVRGYTVNGKATPAKQRKLLAHARQLEAQFGDEPYKLVTLKTVTPKAKVTAAKAKVYAEPNTQSARLLTMKKGAKMNVLAEGEGWLWVQSGSTVGYLKTKLVKRYSTTKTTYSYQPVNVAPPVEENGPKTFAVPETPHVPEAPITPEAPETPELPEVPAPEAEDLGWAVTGGEGAAVRSGAGAGAEAWAVVPGNTMLCVLAREGDWVRVTWQDALGYVNAGEVTLLAEGEAMPAPEAEEEPEPPAAESETGAEGLTLAEPERAVEEPLDVELEAEVVAAEEPAEEAEEPVEAEVVEALGEEELPEAEELPEEAELPEAAAEAE